MITDASLVLSAAQAVTASAVSTNNLDLGTARDIAAGEELYITVTVDETVTADGAATVTIQVITSATADLGSPTVISQTGAIPKADLTAGRKPINIHLDGPQLLAQPIGQRYIGLQYMVATGPLTAGKFTAQITDTEVSVGKNYASGFTVI